ncbi:hypothetical protein L226DRAFT_538423 [Lentinus tigrinus ALCF2SS1-7]|uniref:Uncharacterized protein n=1 Tax=Lentinus tigrinus ALCF2SS1-6 TaxID=1328759 RepID=A0A5C2RZ48_9APHY|nr:hypothetical protein L227DRAFT_579003 [Lentinus tigrinus ALCF2SS1-6]RPD71061.1 hypothetical protein L226DRAFT_538423 [Lentinus tigrinus ALCF2SS1-7]
MAANMEALEISARDFLGRCKALLNAENHHPVDINSVQTIKRDLQLAVVAISQYYNVSPFAPINRLHPELLGMIFQYVREPSKPVKPAKPDRDRFDSYEPLLALMMVCQKWRTLVTQDPTLWNEIDLVEHEVTGPLVRRLLKLSKAVSLDVRFPYPSLVEDSRKKITSFLKAHAHRFENLEVKLGEVDCTSEVLSLLDISMPRLTYLVISNWLGGGAQPPKNVHEMSFKRFPALKALALSGTLLRPKEHIPSLTHLHLVGLADDTILPLLDVLHVAPSLEVLDLRMINLSTTNIQYPTLTFPRLCVLRIDDLRGSNVVHFLLSHLAIPNLAFADLTVNVWIRSIYPGDIGAAYIPPTFFDTRRITRLDVTPYPGSTSRVFIVVEGPDFKLRLIENWDIRHSVLSKSPLRECLGDIEDACLDNRELRWEDALWLAEHLPKVKSLVLSRLPQGLRLLKHGNPILFPELVSLDIDTRHCCQQCEFEELAPTFRRRAELVGGSLQFLRLRMFGNNAERWLDGGVHVQKYIERLEMVNPRMTDKLWTASPTLCKFNDHGYWSEPDFRYTASY